MKRAGMYCRLSKDPDGNMLGIARQEEDCRDLARRNGWKITEVYIDDDVSAYVPGMRPAYERMLVAIAEGVIDAVIVYDEDRLVRHPKELEGFFEICEQAGLTDLASVAGDSDLSNADDQFKLRIKGAFAKKFSDDLSRRYRRMHRQLADAGRWKGGPRPYGYDVARDDLGRPRRDGTLLVVPEEAAIVREAAERVLAGEVLYSICADLNRREVGTAQGAQWRTQTLRRILTCYTHAGQREFQGQAVGVANWPAIIDESSHRRLRLHLLDDSRKVGRRARVFLLTGGFAHCGQCGVKLIGMRRQNGTRTYACQSNNDKNGCGGVQCIAEPLEALVAEAVMLRLDSPRLAQVVAEQGRAKPVAVTEPEVEIVEAQAKLDELADMWAANEINRAEWLRARKPVEARREQAERRLRSSSRTRAAAPWEGKAGALRKAWPNMSLGQQQAVLAAVVERVVVNTTKIRGRFDPERVDIEWRA